MVALELELSCHPPNYGFHPRPLANLITAIAQHDVCAAAYHPCAHFELPHVVLTPDRLTRSHLWTQAILQAGSSPRCQMQEQLVFQSSNMMTIDSLI